jgi:hypothetical protein
VPLLRVILYGLQTSSRAEKITLATNLARDLAEEMRTQAFSEEFVYGSTECSIKTVYPKVADNPQCPPGPDSGESISTAGNGGRIAVYDDVDDYAGWCRGRDCSGAFQPLETYDGFLYNGSQGYPPYLGFTRRVRVHNLDVGEDRPENEFSADPYESYTSTDKSPPLFIKRYNFENWSALTIQTDGTPAAGLTPLKRIEVTVTYEGPVVKGVEVVDVSYVVMPYVKE